MPDRPTALHELIIATNFLNGTSGASIFFSKISTIFVKFFSGVGLRFEDSHENGHVG